MNRVLAAACFLLLAAARIASAQVNVTATSGTASASYASLSAAFAAINAGTHEGVIALSISGNTVEPTSGASLNASGTGSASYASVTISPSAAVAHTIVNTSALSPNGTPLVKLNGASNVTIDGSFGGSGQWLDFRNGTTPTGTGGSYASNVGPTIAFDAGATNDVLKNCIVESPAANATRGEISLGTTGLTSNITITGNDLRNNTVAPLNWPSSVIYGNNAGISSITISNNNIHNFLWSAVNFGGWSNSANVVGGNITITGNSIYNDSPSALTTLGGFCMIGIGGTGDGNVVSGNFIGGKAPACGGAAWPFSFSSGAANIVWGISVRSSGEGAGTSIQGNTIQNIAFGSIVTGFDGINVGSPSAPFGKFAIGTVTGNTIGHPTTANSLTFTTSTQAPAILPINAFGDFVDIRNNVIANLTGSNIGTNVDPYVRGINLFPQLGQTGTWYVENNTLENLSFPGSGNVSTNNSMGIAVTQSGSPTPAVNYDIGGIAGNTLSGLTFGMVGPYYGISINTGSATAGQVVSNNTITGISGVNGFTGISVMAPAAAPQARIQNNTVQGVTLNAPGGEFRGISLTGNPASSGFGPALATGNTIGSDATPNSVTNAGAAATTGLWVEGNNSPAASIDLSNNLVANLTASGTGTGVAVRGIYSGLPGGVGSAGGNVSMSGVSVHDLQTASTNTADGATAPAVAGIWLFGGQTPGVQASSVHALRATTTTAAAVVVDGIWVNGGTGTLQRDRVWDLTSTSGSASAVIRGVYQYGGSWTLANDEISVRNDSNTNPLQVLGVADNSSGSGTFDFNSVYVGGSQAGGSATSYAFLRQSSGAVTLNDNLLYDERTGGSGGQYAVGAAVAGGWSADHDALVASNAAQFGQWAGSDETFASWQAASGGDAASLGEVTANVPSAQLFTDAVNGVLDVKPTTAYDPPPIVSDAGAPAGGITTDFGGVNVRNATYPDIGANEITVSRMLTAPGNLQPASPSYPGNYDDVAVSGGGAPNLTGNVNVYGTLSLGGGNVATNASVLTIVPSGSVNRTAGHVVGNLRKWVPAGGSVSRTFEIGTGGDYAPADLQFASVSTPGYFQATTVGAEHPSIAGSGIDATKDVNRYWTVSNQGAAFTTVNPTFRFVPADVDPGANPALFFVRKYDAPNWTAPATGLQTATSTQALGVTSFSDFAVGDPPTYTLTYLAGPNGSVSGSTPQTVSQGGTGTPVTAVPNTGYHFTTWNDGGTSATRTETNVTANLTVTASFAINSYTLSYAAGANGSLTGNTSQTVSFGGSGTTVTAVPATGYHFVSWSDGGTNASRTDTGVSANLSVTATFAIDTHTLTYLAGANGTISGTTPQTVDYGGSGTPVTAVGNAGYHFTTWSDGGTAATRTETNVTADLSVTATFVSDGSVVGAVSPAACLTPANGCATVPVNITRSDAASMRLFHVDFTLSPNLKLCGSTGASVLEGTYLSSVNPNTTFFVVANGGGSYTVDGSINGLPCGATAATGNLFNIHVAANGGSGTGTVTVDDVTLRDCNNLHLAALPAATPATLTIDTAPVTVAAIPTPQDVAEGDPLTVTPSAALTACASGPVTWSVTPALPVGATFSSSTGVIAWTPACGTAGSYGPFTLTATAATGETGASNAFSITVTHKAGTVTVAAIADPQTVMEQGTLTVTPSATLTACAASPVTWSVALSAAPHAIAQRTAVHRVLSDLPAGATFDASTGTITWTPGCGAAGTYGPFTLTATAATGETGSSNAFSIVLTHKAGTVTVAAITTPQTVVEQGMLTVTPSASLTDCAAGPVTWAVSPALPGGATFSATTGVVSWTPGCGAAGNYGPFTLTATAATGETGASNAFTITVTHLAGTVTVAAIATPQTVAEQGALTVTPSASMTSCATGPLAWTVSPALPGGATLNPATGVITWNPDCAAAEASPGGNYGPFTLTATAATGEAGASNTFTIHVNDTPVAIAAPTGLTATQVLTGNAPGDTTGIVVTFTGSAGASAYKVYRAPFGGYPYYDDAGGAIPAQPGSYPPPSPWQLTGVSASGGTDVPPGRDFWYYVVYAQNACGDVSVASAMTAGTLDYHLGDVTNGYAHGQGDNLVQTEDLSELGANYGITLAPSDPRGYLDVGPTSTSFVDGRPLTDRKINFEDLVMFSIDYGQVSSPALAARAGAKHATSQPGAADELVLSSPDQVVMGDPVTVPLQMQGTGLVQALSIHLSWDPAVVAPVGQVAGDLLAAPNGVVLSAGPGDVDAAMLGAGRGVTGDGEIARVTFKVLAAGDPRIRIESVDARDTRNKPVKLAASRESMAPDLPKVTGLAGAMPNPFRQMVTLAIQLNRRDNVDLSVYSVDGRKVWSLASGAYEAGVYRLTWDGRDDRGNAMAAGVYYARMTAGSSRFTRTLVLLK